MSFWERFKEVLKEKGMKQVEISELLDISTGAVTNWKVQNPSKKNLNYLANILGVNPQWLRTGDGEKYIEVDFANESLNKHGSCPECEKKDKLIQELTAQLTYLREELEKCNKKNIQ